MQSGLSLHLWLLDIVHRGACGRRKHSSGSILSVWQIVTDDTGKVTRFLKTSVALKITQTP